MAVVVSNSVSSLEESSMASASEFGRSHLYTEQLLDYYHSEDAGRTYLSAKSSFCSESEAPTGVRSPMQPHGAEKDGDTRRTSMDSVASSSGGLQRRTSQRSAGGADKRRVAIVELDGRHDPQVSVLREQRSDTSGSLIQPRNHNLFVRRGVEKSHLAGLALVVPPDAQPSNYIGLSPIPSSAPATGVSPIVPPPTTDMTASRHQRSMSEASRNRSPKTSPRDVGIVGTRGSMVSGSQEQSKLHEEREYHRPSTSDGSGARSDALAAPVFQAPRSRSPSPLRGDFAFVQPTASESALSIPGWALGHGQPLTPIIGQEKDIGRPVVGPLVLDLSSGQPTIGRSPRATTSGLPTNELSMSAPHPYGDRDPQRNPARLPFKPTRNGPSYLHYQPGVHSTAGPLPSPPRQMLPLPSSLPPPRPPRLHSPPVTRRKEVDQAKISAKVEHSDGPKTVSKTLLQPPPPSSLADSDYSITAISVSSSGSDDRSPALRSNIAEVGDFIKKTRAAISDRSQSHDHQLDGIRTSRSGSHVREGAFPESSVFLSQLSQSPQPPPEQSILDESMASVVEPQEQEGISGSSSGPAPRATGPPGLSHVKGRLRLKRERSWVSLSAESFGGELDDSSPSSYASSAEGPTQMATTVASNDGSADLRRASLPAPPSHPREGFHSPPRRRTPSLLSMSHPSRSQTSSPSSHQMMPKRVPSSWPDAMNFYDVLSKVSALDRSLAYATKIRELTKEETGLREWLYSFARKERRELPPSILNTTATPSRVFAKQPRHLSRSSMASEVTFPIRQDSYTATDLSPRPMMDLSSAISPASSLPYPSLAHGVGVRGQSSRTLPTESMALSSGSSRSLGSGFFASIGRKTSVKKDRSFPPTSPTKLISSRRPLQPPQPRPVKVGTPPTLPGGPRAPARTVFRPNSVFNSLVQPPAEPTQVRASVQSAEVFNRQVEKLFDLLPHADKDILAGYLRRASNQDPMLAIGTYLEDEKQGCLRQD